MSNVFFDYERVLRNSYHPQGYTVNKGKAVPLHAMEALGVRGV
jgi:hypothetical protein